MKNIILIILALYLSSCDPVSCSSEIIQNNSMIDLKLVRISSNQVHTRSFNIDKMSKTSLGKIKCAMGGVIVNYSAYDSVLLKDMNDNILRIYYPNSTGKNIYDTENRDVWIKNKKGKRDYEFTFEITQEDISPE